MGRRWLAAASSILLGACASQHQWLRAESAHVVVYSQLDEAATRDAVSTLERFGAFLRWGTQCAAAPEKPRLDVYLVDSLNQLQRTWPEHEWASCYVAASDRTFALAVDWEPSEEHDLSAYNLLHAVAAHYRECAPMWLNAALAQYYQEVAFEAKYPNRHRFAGRHDVLHEQSWLKLEDVLGKATFDETEVPLFDQQSWLLLRYLRSDPGRRAALASYLRAAHGGMGPIEALEGATGRDLVALRLEVEAYFARNVTLNPYYVASVEPLTRDDKEALDTYRTLKAQPAPGVSLTILPAPADERLLENLGQEAAASPSPPRCEPSRWRP